MQSRDENNCRRASARVTLESSLDTRLLRAEASKSYDKEAIISVVIQGTVSDYYAQQ